MANPIEFQYILTQIMRCVRFVLDACTSLLSHYSGFNFIFSAIMLAILCTRLFNVRLSLGAGSSDSVKRIRENKISTSLKVQ